jgi:predicted TIM-barrel enzyme
MSLFRDHFNSAKPVIGVIHLPPLPGFDGHPGMDALLRHALADLEVLIS